MDSAVLFSVVEGLVADYNKFNFEEKMNNIIGLLESYERQPASFDKQALQNVVSQFCSAAIKIRFVDCTRAQEVVLKEIDGFPWFGSAIADRVQSAFNDYFGNRQLLLQILKHIRTDYKRFLTALHSMVNGFRALGIESYQLAPGEVRVIIVFPEDIRKFTLERLANESNNLNYIFKSISEMVGDGADDARLTSIGSSDFTVIVKLTIASALCFAGIVAFLLKTYNSILDIKLKTKQLREQNYSEKLIQDLEEEGRSKHNEMVDKKIGELVRKFLEGNATFDEGRRNELINSVKTVVGKIDGYIADGVGFDVDAREEVLDSGVLGVGGGNGLNVSDKKILFNERVAELCDIRKNIIEESRSDKQVLAISTNEKENA